jgi:hypothetical protein
VLLLVLDCSLALPAALSRGCGLAGFVRRAPGQDWCVEAKGWMAQAGPGRRGDSLAGHTVTAAR